MMNNPNDYAVVVGISRYPHLGDLAGSVKDAVAFASWLTDASGGGLPPRNVALVVSDEGNDKDKEKARPTREDVDRAFEPLVEPGPKQRSRRGRRLYIYCAGHSYRPAFGELGLLMANASPKQVGRNSIAVKRYADYFQASGAFEEIVLFVDCDQRVFELSGALMSPPPWAVIQDPSSRAKFFYAAAKSSNERTLIHGESLAHVSFTQSLLEGLQGGAAESDGRVTSDTLREYLRSRLRELGDDDQEPEFISEGGRPIVFVSPKKAEQPEAESVSTQADNPATVDELSRRPFAEVIAARIEEVWDSRGAKKHSADHRSLGAFMVHIYGLIAARLRKVGNSGGAKRDYADSQSVGAFMVLIHGPWGSGKTSVLNFLRENLQDKKRRPEQRWVVIEFNAWRNQRIRPPWWTFIKEIYSQAAEQLDLARSILLRLRWLMWRVRADWLPVLLAMVFILAAILLTTGVINFSPVQTPTSNASVSNGEADHGGNAVELGLKILTAILASGGALVALSRSLVFGSPRAAKMYTELRSDPLSPIVRLFQKLVKGIHRPVVVFVDDLDRCEGKYVIELLEGTQTLFRKAPVTYVVAADRKWISSSFEKGFANFGKTIGAPGRPLGYLFLDKVFQVSASIPQPPPEIRRTYWEGLLRAAGSDNPRMLDETRKQAEREALDAVKNTHTQEELHGKIAEVRNDPVQEQAMRAAAAKQITSPDAQRETEHRLRRFADLLEANPRSMKRLVNAYGFHQATNFLEGRNVAPEALARWTIIELRWPLLADFLSACPQFIAACVSGNAPKATNVPTDLQKLFGDAEVKRVLVGEPAGDVGALDEATVRQIVGLVTPASPTKAAKAD